MWWALRKCPCAPLPHTPSFTRWQHSDWVSISQDRRVAPFVFALCKDQLSWRVASVQRRQLYHAHGQHECAVLHMLLQYTYMFLAAMLSANCHLIAHYFLPWTRRAFLRGKRHGACCHTPRDVQRAPHPAASCPLCRQPPAPPPQICDSPNTTWGNV